MRVGVIVRANRKGLGYQTRDVMDHLPADKVLLVLMASKAAPDDLSLVEHREAVHIPLGTDMRMSPRLLAGFLNEIDVLFSAETLYDWRIADLARRHKVRTVVHGNPEFYTHHRFPGIPQPDRWIWPSSWLTDHPDLPEGPVVPCPAPWIENIAGDPHEDGPLRVLHVAGHAAAADRNGTTDFLGCIPRLRYPTEVTIVSQDGWLPDVRAPHHVKVNRIATGVKHRIEMYEGQHVVVLPRRYGGNCIPATEALGSGCALAMSDIVPNHQWPIVPLAARNAPGHLTPFGRIKTFSVRPSTISDALDRLNQNRGKLERQMAESLAWANAHSWDALRPRYLEALS